MMRVIAAVLLLGVGTLACRDNPNIDGSKVAASEPTCTGVCGRLSAICGQAPPDCDDVDGGYCQTNFDDNILQCMSTAASCQTVWECPGQDTTPTDDGGGDAVDESTPPDDSSTGDAATD